MTYTQWYDSPLGNILLAADSAGLTGVWFNGEKFFAQYLEEQHEEKETPFLHQTKRWLDVYFSGKEPDFAVPFHFNGTDFQNAVWNILCTIPYGHTTTYGEIAKQIARWRGLTRLSAQAVGGAVGRNGISIIVPCHRVIGAHGRRLGIDTAADDRQSGRLQ